MRRGLPRDKEESDTEPGITAGEMDDRMFRDLVESLSHVVFTLDDSGRFTYLSPRCEAILGIPPEQLVGRHITSVVVPADRDRLCSRFRGVQAGSAYRPITTWWTGTGRSMPSGASPARSGGRTGRPVWPVSSARLTTG